jgi:hypothetical protein
MAEPGTKIVSEQENHREIDGILVIETIIHWNGTNDISVDYRVDDVELGEDRDAQTSFDQPLDDDELRELLVDYRLLAPAAPHTTP